MERTLNYSIFKHLSTLHRWPSADSLKLSHRRFVSRSWILLFFWECQIKVKDTKIAWIYFSTLKTVGFQIRETICESFWPRQSNLLGVFLLWLNLFGQVIKRAQSDWARDQPNVFGVKKNKKKGYPFSKKWDTDRVNIMNPKYFITLK